MRSEIRCRTGSETTAHRFRRSRTLFHLSLALLASGCAAVGPDYEPPESSVPDKWEQAVTEEMSSAEPDIMRWWESLGDPQLSKYMTRAREGNPGLMEAVARIREARAFRSISAWVRAG